MLPYNQLLNRGKRARKRMIIKEVLKITIGIIILIIALTI